CPFPFRMLCQRLLVATDTHPAATAKRHWSSVGRLNFEHHYRLSARFELENAEIHPWRKQLVQPRLQVFVARCLMAARLERCPNDSPSAVLHTPDDVPKRLAFQSRRIRQRRQVFADVLGIDEIVLKLCPLRFL